MRALLRAEVQRVLHSALWWATLLIGVAFAVVCAANSIVSYNETAALMLKVADETFNSPFAFSLFSNWMPNNMMKSVPNLYFFMAPLLAALAYAWSARSELNRGYLQGLCVRMPRGSVIAAKHLVVFIAGGLSVAVPLIVNLVVLACCIPAYQPEANDMIYLNMSDQVLFSSLYYRAPWAYTALRIGLDFVLAGLWASLVMGVSLFAHRAAAAVIGSYVALILFKYVSERACWLLWNDGNGWAMTVLDQLRTHGDTFNYAWWALVADIVVMAAVAVVSQIVARRRDLL